MSSANEQCSRVGKEVLPNPGNQSRTNLRQRIVEGINLRKREASSTNLNPHFLLQWFNKNGDGSNSTPRKQAKYGDIPVSKAVDVDEDRMSRNHHTVEHHFRNGSEKVIPGGGQETPQTFSGSPNSCLKTNCTKIPPMPRDSSFRCRLCEMPFGILKDRETHEVDCLVKEIEGLEPVLVEGFPEPSSGSSTFALDCFNTLERN